MLSDSYPGPTFIESAGENGARRADTDPDGAIFVDHHN